MTSSKRIGLKERSYVSDIAFAYYRIMKIDKLHLRLVSIHCNIFLRSCGMCVYIYVVCDFFRQILYKLWIVVL